MNDFHRDNEWQREQRNRILAPGFYGKHATDGRYVFVDKGRLATILQKRFAVDTICQGKNGSAIAIEEKIVRWPGYRYTSLCLETKSCTVPGHESPGWMFYGEADFLLYCFQVENGDLDCWLIDFPKLQEWFWPRETTFPEFRMNNTLNKTAGRKVPIMDVHRAVRTWRKHIEAAAWKFVPIQRPPGTPRHITIVDLQPNDCRWIMNDNLSRAEYCGLPRCAASAVYCADHQRMAYARPSARRNDFKLFR